MCEQMIFWMVVPIFVGLLAGLWIGWECWGRVSKRSDIDIKRSARYAMACEDVLRWCSGDEFRAARQVSGHIHAIGEGEGLNAGTPVADEPCQIAGLREQLRRIEKEKSRG